MALTSYQNLDIRIERQRGRTYCARIIDSASRQATHIFKLPFSDLELDNFRLRMGREGRGLRSAGAPELDAATRFGSQLFSAVFADEVLGILRSSLSGPTTTENRTVGLRIRLQLMGTPELINVPWEFAYDVALKRYLALSTQTPLVRYLDLPETPRAFSIKPPLRILVMIASPSGYPLLEVEKEWSLLQEALRDLEERGLIVLELLPEASLLGLLHQLSLRDYHIFHFVGHGVFDAAAHDGKLLMVSKSGGGVAVSGQELGTVLHNYTSLRLAVLNACEGATSAKADPFAGAAQSLVQQGLPAVIAMQFNISDQAAIIFSQEFYRALLVLDQTVDEALTGTRLALFAQTNGVEWATPVLYLRASDGRIFDLAAVDEKELRLAKRINELVRRAQVAAAAGKWTQAESEWQAVLNLDPAHAGAGTGYEEAKRRRQLDSLNSAIQAARDRGDWPTVVVKLEAVLELDRGNSSAIALLNEAQGRRELAERTAAAQAAEMRHEWDLAVQGWQGVLDLTPDDEQAVVRLATARQEADLVARYSQAAQDADAGRWAAALAGFRLIKAQNPGYRDVDARIAVLEGSLRAKAAPAPIAPTHRTMIWIIGGASIVFLLALAIFLLPRVRDHETGGQAGLRGAVASPTETATQPTLAVAGVPMPTDTAAPAAIPPMLTPEPISAPTHTIAPTHTPTSDPTSTPTLTPSATPTAAPTDTPTLTLVPTARAVVRPSATPVKRPSSTPAALVAPILKSPDDPATTSGITTFVWEWTGPTLTANQGFELLIWKEGQSHDGAFAIVDGDARRLEFDATTSPNFLAGGNGRYFWTVVVAQRTPYLRIGSEASPRTIEISRAGPSEPGPPTPKE